MVIPNAEPWAVSSPDDELDVYDCDGSYKFTIQPHYGNITPDELRRLILCFNACTGIPDGALQDAWDSHNSIWSVGYNVGYGESQDGKAQPDTEQCIFRNCKNTELVLGIDPIGKVCEQHSLLLSLPEIHNALCTECDTLFTGNSVTELSTVFDNHVCA